MNKRWFAVLLAPPLIGGLLLREANSWRPRPIVVLKKLKPGRNVRVLVSPDGKFLMAREGPVALTYGAQDIMPNDPQLVELSSGNSRQFKQVQLEKEFSPFFSLSQGTQWTDRSELASAAGMPLSMNTFFAPDELPTEAAKRPSSIPDTLRPSVELVVRDKDKQREDSISWSESKGHVWLLTRKRWLCFGASSGRLLKQGDFRASNCYPNLTIQWASLCPDGQKAFVEFEDKLRGKLQLRHLWDLRLNKPIRLNVSAFPEQWLSKDFYMDESGYRRHVVKGPIVRPFSRGGDDSYRLDHANHIAIIGAKSVKWYDLTTLKLIEETRLPSMKFNSLDFSPDHSIGYFSVGNEIWRQRLK